MLKKTIKTNKRAVSFDDTIYTDDDIAFINLGKYLHTHPQETIFADEPTENLSDTTINDKIEKKVLDQFEYCIENNVANDYFTWSKTPIHTIQEAYTRELCIVMFQAISVSRLWNKFGENTMEEINHITKTMGELGYVGKMEPHKLRYAIQMMYQIKRAGLYK
jgi:hypothetical protein